MPKSRSNRENIRNDWTELRRRQDTGKLDDVRNMGGVGRTQGPRNVYQEVPHKDSLNPMHSDFLGPQIRNRARRKGKLKD